MEEETQFQFKQTLAKHSNQRIKRKNIMMIDKKIIIIIKMN